MLENKRSAPKAVTPGMMFDFLEVIEKDDPYVPPDGGKTKTRWKCKCQLCGNEITLTTSALHTRKNKSCGCTNDGVEKPEPSVAPGRVFGFLEVIGKAGRPYVPPGGGKPTTRWKCRCQLCVNEIALKANALLARKEKSCGCANDGLGKHGAPVKAGAVFVLLYPLFF